jgi:monooxygenase
VTIIPVIAETAAHVAMLQRSATYIVARPTNDQLAMALRRYLPTRTAYALARWYYVLFGLYFYNLSRRKPRAVKKWIMGQVRAQLGPDYDVLTHFNPPYNPWDQRLCLAPDADFFRAIKSGKADVVTDTIEGFTERGIRLKSGRELEADIIVTATGLKLLLLGGIKVAVDGKPVTFADTMNYKGVMFSDVPNLFAAFGYTNASWTLKSDLTAEYVCRLLKYMQTHEYDICAPRNRDPSITEQPAIDFSSGYIQRALPHLPKQGSKRPWRLHQNYALDMLEFRLAPVNDGVMEFARAAKTAVKLAATVA